MEKLICNLCLRNRPVKRFHKNTTSARGYGYRCKSCRRKTRDAEGERQYKLANKEKIKSYRKIYNEVNKVRRAYTVKKSRLKDPIKTKARNMVTRALANGTLVRPDICSECPSRKSIQAHHEDYNKPLDVEWLCFRCHMARHHILIE